MRADRMHSYVLMGNHYHMLLETPEPNLSTGMQWLQSIYTIRHNVKHRLRGHLFQGRYKAIPVDGEDWTYFRTVSDYIYLNPARALEKSAHGRPEPSKPVLLRCCRTAGHQKTCQEVRNVNRHGLTPLVARIPLKGLFPTSHPEWLLSFGRYDYTPGQPKPVLSSTSHHAVCSFHRKEEWRRVRLVELSENFGRSLASWG